MIFFAVALVGLSVVQAAVAPINLEGQALVDFINTNALTWHAELNTRFEIKKRLMRPEYVKRAVGMVADEAPVHSIDSIPDSFDARTVWPKCSSIGHIRDQSDCGSCWAFGAVEVITDRICIENGGTWDEEISAVDLLSCCTSCGLGCEGGYPLDGFKYWVDHGICTGSSYGEKQGCKPYPFAPCGHHNGTYYKKCPHDVYSTPECKQTCQTGYGTSYVNDKHYGRSAYFLSQHVPDIQKEILTHGPVEAAFTVYGDFEQYKGGVYHYTFGDELGGHAVKILGWGTDKGTPYWLVANSWDTDWGENGFFRIRRGTNECGIEENIVAGLAKLKGM